MAQPQGFIDRDYPHHVYELRSTIYGLKQAPRAWYHKLCQFLITFGFVNSHADFSHFIFNNSGVMIYLLVYVNDIIIIGENDGVVQQFITLLAQRLSIKDFGYLTYFLGVEVASHPHGLLFYQRCYITDLLAHIHIIDAKLVTTQLLTFTPTPLFQIHLNIRV